MGCPTWVPTFRPGFWKSGQGPRSKSKYNTLVPDPTGYVFPVEVFEQGDSVLPADSRKFLERSYRQAVATFLSVLGQQLAQPATAVQ